MTTLYMLVGLPGVGKSTWTDSFRRKNRDQLINNSFYNNTGFIDNLTIISTDNIIESIADEYRLTYNQLFDDITYSFAEKMSYKIAKLSIDREDIIIWDQTNLTKKTRKRKLDMFPSEYKKVCVLFGIPDDLDKRLMNRPGKVIPDKVIKDMIMKYEQPTTDEGFDDIIMNYHKIDKYC